MPDIATFVDQFARVQSGDPWYGPPIRQVLNGLGAAEAAAHPVPGAHSIWELTLHLTSWVREVRRRLVNGDWRMPADGDWPRSAATTEENWHRAVAALEQAHEELGATLAGVDPAVLADRVGTERDPAAGTGITYEDMLHGLLQHDAYHLGQISLLRKATEARQISGK
jgi:uncharacterized damage-inducible protein DinB